MTNQDLPLDEIKEQAEQAAAHPWVERFVRFGFAAKGIVYLVIGLLAAQVAFGLRGETADTKGALITIMTQPFGRLLLCILTVGLIGYVLWRLIQAFLDPEHEGTTNAQRLVQRLGYIMSGLSYTGVAITAMQIIIGSFRNHGNMTKDWTARLLLQPFGQWLVGLVGVVVVGVGISYLYEAYSAKSINKLKSALMHDTLELWTTFVGRFGIAARGIVFVIIGIFVIRAALLFDSNQAKGLGGTLQTLAQQPFGSWILGVVAVGFIAYGIYMLIAAWYRHFATVD